ncbi:MAG: hypothetical protein OXQ99_14585, partial [Chloroflexota bacterium]|nr:hypothetical protein [Chloroflexota bacterium]
NGILRSFSSSDVYWSIFTVCKFALLVKQVDEAGVVNIIDIAKSPHPPAPCPHKEGRGVFQGITGF